MENTVCCLLLDTCPCQLLLASVGKGLPMQPGGVPNLCLAQHLRVLNPPVLFCYFYFQSSVPLTGMPAFSLRSPSENTCQEVMNICEATILITSFQPACMLTETWLHDVPRLVFMWKVAQATGRMEKPPGKTWETWEGQCTMTPGSRQLGLPGSMFPLWRSYVGVHWLHLVNWTDNVFWCSQTMVTHFKGRPEKSRHGQNKESAQQDICYALAPLHLTKCFFNPYVELFHHSFISNASSVFWRALCNGFIQIQIICNPEGNHAFFARQVENVSELKSKEWLQHARSVPITESPRLFLFV